MSARIPVDRLLSVLRYAPAGLTSAEVADRLEAKVVTVSTRLSKLADYGRIDREFERFDLPTGETHRRCRWRSKELADA